MFTQEVLISSVFVAGFLSFFAPCTFPLIPVYIGILTDEVGEYKKITIGNRPINVGALIKTVTFVLGIATSFVLLGFGAGFVGKLFYNRIFLFLSGLIVFLFGLHQMELIKIKKIENIKGITIKNNKAKALGTYLMGVSFSVGGSTCATPIIGAILVTSATSGKEFYGAFLMLIYSIGLMIPFFILSLFSDFVLKKFEILTKHIATIKKIGGLLVAFMGILLMSNTFNKLVGIWS